MPRPAYDKVQDSLLEACKKLFLENGIRDTEMQQIAAAGIARAGVSSATVVVLMLPPMILFLILQSNVVETMAHSGLKD